MALLKGIHLSSRHWEDLIESEKCSGEEPLSFNEVSVIFYVMKFTLIRVVPRYINLVPLWDWGFFVYLKYKGGIHDAGTFTRTASRSVAKS